MKEYVARHRTVLGFTGAFVAACIALVYVFILPAQVHTAKGLSYFVLTYGHSICWLFILLFFVLWAKNILPRLRSAMLYSALLVYIVFIVTLSSSSS